MIPTTIGERVMLWQSTVLSNAKDVKFGTDYFVTRPFLIDTVKHGDLPLLNVFIVIRVTITVDVIHGEWSREFHSVLLLSEWSVETPKLSSATGVQRRATVTLRAT